MTIGYIAMQIGIMFGMLFFILAMHFMGVHDKLDVIIDNQITIIKLLNGTIPHG